jgi:hypothetical protein
VARLFAESFAEEGLKVWWDAVLHSGETFDEVIERNLRAAKAVVVLWSPQSVTSRWVRAEATQADRANKLVPAIIEQCNLPIIFELTHTTDLTGWQGDRSDGRWQSFIDDLRRLVGPAEVAAPIQEAPLPEEPKPVPGHAAGDDELAKVLQRLAQKQRSVLQEPTPVEDAQANFFKRSDEFRQTEGAAIHCLRRLHAPDSEPIHAIGPSGLKIGRKSPADVIVYEPGVSREHCMVELAADKLRVTDLNSTNGTYIDDKRIGRAEILPVGSVLRVGNVSFEHEVHTREEFDQMGEAIGFNLGTDPREPRIARSS